VLADAMGYGALFLLATAISALAVAVTAKLLMRQ
jgi:hypothetical protein